jgi:hypothetical protein
VKTRQPALCSLERGNLSAAESPAQTISTAGKNI